MARPAPSEQSAKKAHAGKTLSRMKESDKGLRLSTPLPHQRDALRSSINDRVEHNPIYSAGTPLDIPEVKFRTKARNGKVNQPLPTRSAEMPAYTALRELLTRKDVLSIKDIIHAVDGNEKHVQRALDTLAQDDRLSQDQDFQERKNTIQEYLNKPLPQQLQAHIDELNQAVRDLTPADKAAGIERSLRFSLANLNTRLERATADDRFATSLMDGLDAKKIAPDLEELTARLSGIQDAVAKLNQDVIGENRVKDLRARAEQYQGQFAAKKTADGARPREVAAADFTRIERQVADFGRALNSEEGLRYPDKVRKQINELRKEVSQLSNIPGATENPRYEALLEELNAGELAIASAEGDELAQLLQEMGDNDKILDELPTDAPPTYRPDATDLVEHRVNQTSRRLKEAYDGPDARHSPTYGELKRRMSDIQGRIAAFRNPPAAPRVEVAQPEARTNIPEGAAARPTTSQTRFEATGSTADETAIEDLSEYAVLVENEGSTPVPKRAARATPRRPEPKKSHAAIIDPKRTIDVQQLEAEMHSSNWTQHVIDLEKKLTMVTTHAEKQTLDDQLVLATEMQDDALRAEFILLSADPQGMAKALDRAVETQDRIFGDVIGRETVTKIRALEDAGTVLDDEAIRSFQDADERDFARRWLDIKRTSRMVEQGIQHLRDYHRAQIELFEHRENTIRACKSCIIPKAIRDELDAAATPTEKRGVVDNILKHPETMDQPIGAIEWMRKYAIRAAQVFKFKTFLGRRFGSDELEQAVRSIEYAQNNFNFLKQGRANFEMITPPGTSTFNFSTESTPRDPLAPPSETKGPFEAFMEISQRAGRLITDLKSFNGDVSDTVISRFNSRLSNMEEEMSGYETAPPAVKSIFDLAQAKLVDARQELANLQRRQVQEVPLQAPRTGTSAEAHREQENPSDVLEATIDLQMIQDDTEILLDQVNTALNEDHVLGEQAFHDLDYKSILLNARLRHLEGNEELPAYKAAERTLQELEEAFERYEERKRSKDSVNKNRPAEAIFQNAIANSLKKIANDNPRSTALAHYLAELNDGQGVRVDDIDAVQEALLSFLQRYSSLHPTEQRVAARSFQQIYEILDLSELYRDLGINSLNQLVVRVGVDRTQVPVPGDDAVSNIVRDMSEYDPDLSQPPVTQTVGRTASVTPIRKAAPKQPQLKPVDDLEAFADAA